MAEGGWFKRWVKRLVLLGLILVVLGVGVLAGMYWYFVVENPGDHLDREHILSVISQESPVFYRDRETKIGVFFSEQHRQYVPKEKLPEDFVNALVAAEDKTFFEHHGFSPQGIARAMLQNLRAGRTVAGGSTLTQQTAKNLFERQGRTYKEKLRELANALRLERLYTKREILEFYSNQFYVNGNGRGLGIAARFFFDAEVHELDLLQNAFLAGIVKVPNRYNPFVPDEARRKRAMAAGRERVDYVLGRMLEDGYIDEATYQAALKQEIPYQRGRFRYERSVVLDYVEEELNSPAFRAALAAHDVDDPGRAGLQIITTLDQRMQEQAVYSLRHHLSDVGLWLEPRPVDALFSNAPELRPTGADDLRAGTVHRGLLESVDVDKGTARVRLGPETVGVLDDAGVQRLATALLRGEQKNTWVEARRQDRKALLTAFSKHVGEGLQVSVRTAGEEPLVDVEADVELEGAILVLEDGAVRAMVGGWENEDFNRAVRAKRQLGSTWKPVLFEAALQLGWSALDELDNRRGVFPYQTTFYYPRPDHTGAPERVSIAWATTKSENLATIWLLDHLSDPLTEPQFRALAEQVGLAPDPAEDGDAWVKRVQDKGVLPTEEGLMAGLFRKVWADEIAPDLLFEGREEDAKLGASLHYGRGFEAERERVNEDRSLSAAERALRNRVLDRSFLRQEALAARFGEARAALVAAEQEGRPIPAALLDGFVVRRPDPEHPEVVSVAFGDRHDDGWEALTVGALEQLVERPEPEPSDFAPEPADDSVWDDIQPARREDAEERRAVRARPPREREDDEVPDTLPEPTPAPASEDAPPEPEADPRLQHLDRIRKLPRPASVAELLSPERVRLEGLLTPGLVERARVAIDRAREGLTGTPLYSFDALALQKDFRLLVHIEYVIQLARRSGVRSEIAPVMSLPLGSSDITLLEAALLYQGMLLGHTNQFYADALSISPGDPSPVGVVGEARRADLSIVAEVRLADGETVIYSTAREREPLHSPQVAAELGGMLRSVVTHGTGRRAAGGAPLSSDDPERRKELAQRNAALPLFGKTGTTNSYKNSAFVGFVPGLPPRGSGAAGGEGLTWGHGFVVATYVGYDDNREMRNGSVRLAGASGSLPAWIGAAEGVAAHSDIGDRVDLVDLDFSGGGMLPVGWPEGMTFVAVDASTGLPLEDAEEDVEAVVRLPVRAAEPAFEPIEPLRSLDSQEPRR